MNLDPGKSSRQFQLWSGRFLALYCHYVCGSPELDPGDGIGHASIYGDAAGFFVFTDQATDYVDVEVWLTTDPPAAGTQAVSVDSQEAALSLTDAMSGTALGTDESAGVEFELIGPGRWTAWVEKLATRTEDDDHVVEEHRLWFQPADDQARTWLSEVETAGSAPAKPTADEPVLTWTGKVPFGRPYFLCLAADAFESATAPGDDGQLDLALVERWTAAIIGDPQIYHLRALPGDEDGFLVNAPYDTQLVRCRVLMTLADPDRVERLVPLTLGPQGLSVVAWDDDRFVVVGSHILGEGRWRAAKREGARHSEGTVYSSRYQLLFQPVDEAAHRSFHAQEPLVTAPIRPGFDHTFAGRHGLPPGRYQLVFEAADSAAVPPPVELVKHFPTSTWSVEVTQLVGFHTPWLAHLVEEREVGPEVRIRLLGPDGRPVKGLPDPLAVGPAQVQVNRPGGPGGAAPPADVEEPAEDWRFLHIVMDDE